MLGGLGFVGYYFDVGVDGDGWEGDVFWVYEQLLYMQFGEIEFGLRV